MICGNAVAPTTRIAAPHSRSAETSRGRRERRCRAFSLAAMSNGDPTEMIRPPTSRESTQRAVAPREPGNDERAHALRDRERGEDGVGGDRRRGPGAGGGGGGGDRPRRVSAGT